MVLVDADDGIDDKEEVVEGVYEEEEDAIVCRRDGTDDEMVGGSLTGFKTVVVEGVMESREELVLIVFNWIDFDDEDEFDSPLRLEDLASELAAAGRDVRGDEDLIELLPLSLPPLEDDEGRELDCFCCCCCLESGIYTNGAESSLSNSSNIFCKSSSSTTPT